MGNLTVNTKGFLGLRAIGSIKTFITREHVISCYFATSYLVEDQAIDWICFQVQSIPESFTRYILVIAVKIWLGVLF